MTSNQFRKLTQDDLEHMQNHYYEHFCADLEIAAIPFLHPDRITLMLSGCSKEFAILNKLELVSFTDLSTIEMESIIERFRRGI